ncbi:glycosyltransferase [Bacteroides sp.]|uniref:glycosyltransferase n=1 Tax=Bacteroides sp. TaxID=29523 RepID=UPI00402796A2
MPTLLQINTCINKSTGRIAQQIGEKAMTCGWQSYIAYSAREQQCESCSVLLPVGSKRDAHVHALFSRLFDCQGLLSKKSTKQLIENIKKIRPDVIHLHNIHGYYLNYPLLFQFLKEYEKPVVWTLHDCWAFTGHCVHYTDVGCFLWKTGCHNCPKKKSYPSSFLFDRSKRNYNEKKEAYANMQNLILVPVSYWLGDVTRQSILGKYSAHVIQNGIDINVFFPRTYATGEVRRKYRLQGKYIIIGVATGWSEEVGLSSFFELRKKLPKEKFTIVMVGCTSNIMRQLPDGIVGVPRTNSVDELAELYSTADILFNGSYQETFGLVTAEALACGTPVIVYNSTACSEIVTPKTGYIAEPKNIDQVLNFIWEDSAKSEKCRRLMSARCREYAVEHFDKEEKYKSYMELYSEIINKCKL